MIDPHVHLRDWNQKHKETVQHGLAVASKIGLNAIFEMPNTDPALTSRIRIKERIVLADKVYHDVFHGVYAGITKDPKQITEAVNAFKELCPRVVGLKMFAGHSTGNMGIIEIENQRLVYQTLAKLDYGGVLAVHCEKESLIDKWDPKKPFTHTLARPPEAEVESVKDQIQFARDAGFMGTLHICHISVPSALEEIEKQRNNVSFKITCGLTPHHALMYDEMMNNNDGILLKMNPPLRPKEMQEYMLQALLDGRIDWTETDHAPHTLIEKNEKFMSGIPGLQFYSKFIQFLKKRGASNKLINNITHKNIEKNFKINIVNKKSSKQIGKEYEFDAFEQLKDHLS